MARFQNGGDAPSNFDVNGLDAGDGNAAFRGALRSTQMTTALGAASGDDQLGNDQSGDEQSLGQSGTPSQDVPSRPIEIFAAPGVTSGSFILSLGEGAAGIAAAQAAGQALDLSGINTDKLQYGLGAIYAEALQRVAGLEGEDRDLALTEFTSSNFMVRIVDGMVAIDAVASNGDGAALLARLEALGLKSGASFGAMAGGFMPVDALDELANLDLLNFARPVYSSSNVGLVTGQPYQSMNVDTLVAAHPGTNGAGITVGVLSDSFDTRTSALTHYADDVVNGDLPAGVNILKDSPTPGTDEGRAMAQAIYDIAPGVNMAFYTAFVSMADFAAGIVKLSEPVASGGGGADIIVDDVVYFAEPMFQDGIVAQAVQQAAANGAMYFSSAGNQGTASYQGLNLADSGVTFTLTTGTALQNGTFHLLDFDPGPGVDFSQTINKGSTSSATFVLSWDQPSASAGGAGSASDLILLVLNASNQVTNVFQTNNIGGDPFEAFGFGAGGTGSFRIAIGVRDGNPMPGLVKWVAFGGGIQASEYANFSSAGYGHNNADTAISVGASDWVDSSRFGTFPIVGQPFPYQENFSSKGGTPIYFDTAGNRLATPQIRTSVDLTASDGGNNSFFGGDATYDADTFPNFYGTSQAAPNAAAVAALLMQAFPTATNAEIEAALKLSAIDVKINFQNIGANAGLGTGYDLTSGTGLIQADAAYNAMAIVMANNDPVIGTADLAGGVAELVTPAGNLVDTGTIAFTDADGAEAHIVTAAFPTGGVIGSLNVALTTDTDAGGTGGLITWTYTVAASAAEYLAAGETKVDTFTFYLDDQHGSMIPIVVNATVTGTEDAPVVTLVTTDSAAKSLAETNAALASTGTVTVTDVDYSNTVTPSVQSVAATGTVLGLTSDNAAQKAWMTVSPGTLTANVGEVHNLTWSFNSGSQNFDYLAASESLVLTYTLQVADNNATPGTATQAVTITITGSNDGPSLSIIGTDSASASLTETNAGLSTAGTLTAVDPDLSDKVTATVLSVGASGNLAGLVPNNAALKAMLSLTAGQIDADVGTQHNLTWTFNSGSEAFNYLAFGESLVLTYAVRVADGAGLFADRNVVVTINGANDAPTLSILGPLDSGSAAFTDSASPVILHGKFTAIDPDPSDSVTAKVLSATVSPGAGVPSDALTMLTVSPTTLAADAPVLSNLAWTFMAGANAFDYLAASETQTITYVVQVTDGSGATATQNVVITVTGTNEGPVIGASLPASTAVVEIADGAAGENSAALTGSGTITFSDTDVNDTHVASVVANGSGYLGSFTLGSVNQAADSVGWNFSVSDAALNALGQGAVIHQSYTVTVTDNHGVSSQIVVGVDLIGSNDAAVLSSANVVVTQGLTPATAGGTLTITDEDNPALYQVLNGYHGTYGSLSLAANGNWSYVADGPLLNLAPGQVATDSFTVHAVDGTPTTITVNIAGSNDIAIARMDNFVTTEAATLGSGLSLFADNGAGADADPDGPPLAISAVNGDAAFVGHQIQLASGALLTVNANGTFAYNPNHAFDYLTLASGAANQFAYDSFTYTLAGGTTATVFVNVTGVSGAGDLLRGDIGNNVVTGFGTGDTFRFEQGGNDTGYGLGGNDGFYFGGSFDGQDHVDGGDGTDTLALQGNTHADLGGVTNVEVILALSGSDTRFGDTAGNSYDYDLTTSDANVAAGQTLTVQATGLLPGEDMHFDGSAETDGNFRVFAGRGNDVLIGGAGSDGFFFGADGNLTGADHVEGGAGVDTVALRGNYVGANAVVFQNGSLSGIEVMAFLTGHSNPYGGPIVAGGFDYDVTMADGNVAAGQRLDVSATGLGADESVRFDGHLETNGSFRILSGAGDDNLIGGSGDDQIYGGLGADRLEGGAGADTFTYLSAAESTSTHYDVIVGFDWHQDRIDAPGGTRMLNHAGTGALSTASFDADLAAGLNGVLGSGQAALFTATSGTLSGHVFAVIDANGVAGYQAGEDLVIELVNAVTPIDPTAGVIL